MHGTISRKFRTRRYIWTFDSGSCLIDKLTSGDVLYVLLTHKISMKVNIIRYIWTFDSYPCLIDKLTSGDVWYVL